MESALKAPLKVKVLILRGQNIVRLSDSITTFRNLETLSLEQNKGIYMNDALVTLSNLKKLSSLNISNCDIDAVLVNIKLLKQLKVLKLGGNKLTGLPDEISELKKLKELTFSQYPDDFRSFSLDEKKKIVNALPHCKILLEDYFGGAHGKCRLGQRVVRVTPQNVNTL